MYVCQHFMNNLICFCTLMSSNQGGDTYMNPDIDSDMESTAKQRMLDEYYGENRGTYDNKLYFVYVGYTIVNLSSFELFTNNTAHIM